MNTSIGKTTEQTRTNKGNKQLQTELISWLRLTLKPSRAKSMHDIIACWVNACLEWHTKNAQDSRANWRRSQRISTDIRPGVWSHHTGNAQAQKILLPGDYIPGEILASGGVEAMWSVWVNKTRGRRSCQAVEVPGLVPRRWCAVEHGCTASQYNLIAW